MRYYFYIAYIILYCIYVRFIFFVYVSHALIMVLLWILNAFNRRCDSEYKLVHGYDELTFSVDPAISFSNWSTIVFFPIIVFQLFDIYSLSLDTRSALWKMSVCTRWPVYRLDTHQLAFDERVLFKILHTFFVLSR